MDMNLKKSLLHACYGSITEIQKNTRKNKKDLGIKKGSDMMLGFSNIFV